MKLSADFVFWLGIIVLAIVLGFLALTPRWSKKNHILIAALTIIGVGIALFAKEPNNMTGIFTGVGTVALAFVTYLTIIENKKLRSEYAEREQRDRTERRLGEVRGWASEVGGVILKNGHPPIVKKVKTEITDHVKARDHINQRHRELIPELTPLRLNGVYMMGITKFDHRLHLATENLVRSLVYDLRLLHAYGDNNRAKKISDPEKAIKLNAGIRASIKLADAEDKIYDSVVTLLEIIANINKEVLISK